MATARDLYDVLGIERGASDEDIKKAYRRLARALHPDVNTDPRAEERFKEVAGAYEILSDPERRARYDAFGRDGGPAGQAFTDISQIFEMFFGQGGFGGIGGRTRREVSLERMIECDRCLGNGAEPGTAPIACRTCGGTGEVGSVRRSVFGTLMTSSPCSTCQGTGQEIPDRCERCGGAGRVATSAQVTVEIPAGVSDGMELRVGEAGHAGVAGGGPGDLYVRLDVEESPSFERRGQDLFAVLDVSVTQATLGSEVRVPCIDGPESLKLEPGTESGTVVRLKGRGIPNVNRRGRGDLYVTVHVVTPRGLSKQERGLFERLAELRGEAAKQPVEAELRRPEF